MTTVAMLAVDHTLGRKWSVRPQPHVALGAERIRRAGRLLTRTMLLVAMVVAISGCAVGPNFTAPAAPDVAGYVPGKLNSPNPGPGAPRVAGQHFVSGADVSARWWSAFKSQPLNDLVKQSVDHN